MTRKIKYALIQLGISLSAQHSNLAPANIVIAATDGATKTLVVEARVISANRIIIYVHTWNIYDRGKQWRRQRQRRLLRWRAYDYYYYYIKSYVRSLGLRCRRLLLLLLLIKDTPAVQQGRHVRTQRTRPTNRQLTTRTPRSVTASENAREPNQRKSDFRLSVLRMPTCSTILKRNGATPPALLHFDRGVRLRRHAIVPRSRNDSVYQLD